jgi:hypothetical protein
VPRPTHKSLPTLGTFHTNHAYFSMPLQTRNIAKGIAPRLHLPKSTKPKPQTSPGKNGHATKQPQTRKHRKRVASESEDEGEESSESENSDHKARKKKQAKWQASMSDEVEEVDADDEPTMEQIEDGNEEHPGPSDEPEVSTNS